jgi:hypothetical protein
MTKPENLNLWADDMEPKVTLGDIIVEIRVPLDRMKHKTNEMGSATLTIERESGYVAGFDWYWFGVKNPRSYNKENWHLLDVRKEVVDWLHEWELIETRPIGPEDSEYFATDKLMGMVE